MVGVRSKSKGLLHILLVLLACFVVCYGFENIAEMFGREGAINVTDENAWNSSSGGSIEGFLGFPFITQILCPRALEVFTGIILSENSVITTCRTINVFHPYLGSYQLQPEDCFVFSISPLSHGGRVVNKRVLSILQHPACGQPHRGGSWKNNLAIFMLTTELDFIPHQLEKVEFASMDFKELYQALKKVVNGEVTCSLFGVSVSILPEFSMVWISMNVTIVREPRCERICDYLIEHCYYELGGYFIMITDPNKRKLQPGAALMCDGHLYGVVDTTQDCGGLYDGLMSKPEAMLELVWRADSSSKISRTRNGSATRSYPFISLESFLSCILKVFVSICLRDQF